ncbi:hypothetical protein P5V15_000857 [Pogonomyrmex californicus]
MSPADATSAVVEDAARRRHNHTCVRGQGDDSGRGYHRKNDDGSENDGDDGDGDGDDDDDDDDDGDVALAIRFVRHDALRRRRRR